MTSPRSIYFHIVEVKYFRSAQMLFCLVDICIKAVRTYTYSGGLFIFLQTFLHCRQVSIYVSGTGKRLRCGITEDNHGALKCSIGSTVVTTGPSMWKCPIEVIKAWANNHRELSPVGILFIVKLSLNRRERRRMHMVKRSCQQQHKTIEMIGLVCCLILNVWKTWS